MKQKIPFMLLFGNLGLFSLNCRLFAGDAIPGKKQKIIIRITGNSYYDIKSGTEAFMEDPALLLCPTIFERAAKAGVRSALFSSKKKSISLLSKGTDISLSPETASAEWISRIGTPPAIYSREVKGYEG